METQTGVVDAVPAETPHGSEQAPAGWRTSLAAGAWAWLAAVVGAAVVTYLSWLPFYKVASPAGKSPTSVLEAIGKWQQWDTNWYLIVAEHGYTSRPQSAAFFPLYPMLVRAAGLVLPGPGILAALLVSSLAALGVLILLHRLALLVFGRAVDANRAVFFLIAFPAGFFLLAGYNESLFLLLSLASLLAARSGRWWMAGAYAGLASGTRLAGVLLAVALVYEYARQKGLFADRRFAWRRIRADVLGIGLAPAGAVAYAAYCWSAFGDPMYFSKVQGAWHREGYYPPWVSTGRALKDIFTSSSVFEHSAVHNVLNLGVVIAAATLLMLALVGPCKLGRENVYLTVFAGLSLLLPVSTPLQTDFPLASMLRYALEFVPVFLVLARIGRSERFSMAYLAAGLAAQGVLLTTFLHNQFIA